MAANPGGIAYNASTTGYVSLTGGLFVGQTTNSHRQRIYEQCSLHDLFIVVSANGLSAAFVCRLRNTGVLGNNQISVGAGATGTLTDIGATDDGAPGDVFDIRIVTAAGGTSATVNQTGVTVDSPLIVNRTGLTANNSVANNLTIYLPVTGRHRANDTTESHEQTVIRNFCIWRNARLWCVSNTGISGTVVARLNGAANTTLQLAIGAGSTGEVEDTTGDIHLKPGDLINWRLITGNEGALALTISLLHSDLAMYRDDDQIMLGGTDGTSTAITGTVYAPIAGDSGSTQATEAFAQTPMMGYGTKGRVKRMFINMRAMGSNRTITTTLRNNGQSSPEFVVVTPASTTGLVETISDTNAFKSDSVNYDLLCFQHLRAAGGTGTGNIGSQGIVFGTSYPVRSVLGRMGRLRGGARMYSVQKGHGTRLR